MDQRIIIVCSVVGSIGVLSAILGFSAEGTKLTISDVYVGGGLCLYPQNPALGLGVCAAIFLIVAQIILAGFGGCCGCCKSRAIPSETSRIIGVVCAVFSWITAIIAFALLATGAAWNATGTRDSSVFGLCYVLKDGIFAGGAVLTLVATALGVTSSVMLRGQPAAAAAPPAVLKEGEQMSAGVAGIAMGQPQLPQQPPQWKGHGQAPNAHYPPPRAQGYGAHAANQQQQQEQLSPPPARGYGQYPPPKGHEQM
ncbi:uncharacterized protein LOC123415692 [Hordeum vulgare subsp. vulgare]|uniref:Uncharacterized protein n=1 Tax=Hordeum vulgare subsp. vulgare TaxID=112509 RepID=A0A8I6WSP0_HORVV|nr:uncharacterized protein LOC123415692 [Hordeum vulgare subsp. vulgare]